MESTLHTLLKSIVPGPELENRIKLAWEENNRKYERNKFLSFLVFTFSCFAATVSSVIYLVQAFTRSGFSSYLSLILSERLQVLTYFKEFSLSLVESIPILSVAVFLCVFGVFLWSLLLLTKPVINLYGNKKFV
jgi:hypothetical protein